MTPLMVPPLIHFLERSGCSLSPEHKSGGATVTSVVRHVYDALLYLKRGSPGDMELADLCLDDAFARFHTSERVSLLHWSGRSRKKRVVTLSDPVDHRLFSQIHGHLIVKEYYRDDGTADLETCAHLTQLNAELYHSRLAGTNAPRGEIAAATRRRAISLRVGKSLPYEHLPEHPLEGPRRLQEVLANARWLVEYLGNRPELLRGATCDLYGEKFVESLQTLKPFLPRHAHREFERACVMDIETLERILHGARLVPHIDPTAVNMVVEDSSLMHIDLEKAVRRYVVEDHLYAHAWFDPAWELSPDDRVSGLGERGIPLAFYYAMRQVSRGLRGVYAVPFGAWSPAAKARLQGYLASMRFLAAHASQFRCAPLLVHLDTVRLDEELVPAATESRLEVKYHGGA